MRVSSRVLSVFAVTAAVLAAPVPIALASQHGGHDDDRPMSSASPSTAVDDGQEADDRGRDADEREAEPGDDAGQDEVLGDDGATGSEDAADDSTGATRRKGRPARPTAVDAQRTAFDRVVVTWRSAADPAAFVVRLKAKGDVRTARVAGTQRSVEFAGLAADTRWRTDVRAVAVDGTRVAAAKTDVLRTPSAADAAKVTARAAEKAAKRAARAARKADDAQHRARTASGEDRSLAAHTAAKADKAAKRAAKRARAAAREASRAERQHRAEVESAG